MPAKRKHPLGDKENVDQETKVPKATISIILRREGLKSCSARTCSTVTGTVPKSQASKTQVGNSKTSGRAVSSLERKEPQTEEEKSKVEESMAAIMKTRQELEKLMPKEGSSELCSVLLMSPADLHTELKRHKELTSKVGGCVNAAQRHEGCLRGRTQTGSSYEFLKEILSG